MTNKDKFKCSKNKIYCECPHVFQLPFDKKKWLEIILIGNNRTIAHPIHQHGGWYWVVGGGQYDDDFNITREFIIQQGKEGKLNYTNSDRSVPKDVIQVPRNGYVIIRTKLDNPGIWIFHCHIDFHLSLGMALVLQIGEQGDWNTGPLKHQLDVPCDENPPSPLGGLFFFLLEERFPLIGNKGKVY